MNLNWFFSKELSPSNVLVDKFADSKFEIDRWTSFAREIVQNSLDAQDDPSIPVKIVFDLNKTLTIQDIPGGSETLEILKKSFKAAENVLTAKGSKYYQKIEFIA